MQALTHVATHWPYRLSVRTKASQALKPGSIPGRVTDFKYLFIKLF